MKRDWMGTLIGLAVFFGGLLMIWVTFQQAWVMFGTPPAQALGLAKGKPLVPEDAGANLVGILIKILLLFVLSVCGSLVAGKGVSLFAASRVLPAPKIED